MAQHAKPKLKGQMEDLRAQFTAWSSLGEDQTFKSGLLSRYVECAHRNFIMPRDGFLFNPNCRQGQESTFPRCSRMQQNLAEELASLHLFLRGGRFLQGECGIDHRFQFAVGR